MEHLPRWVGADGYPLSWRHYVLGTRHLTKGRAREQIRTYDAMLMAQAQKPEDKREWVRTLKIIAGWE